MSDSSWGSAVGLWVTGEELDSESLESPVDGARNVDEMLTEQDQGYCQSASCRDSYNGAAGAVRESNLMSRSIADKRSNLNLKDLRRSLERRRASRVIS